MKQIALSKIAIATSVFVGAAVLSFGGSGQGGVSLSVESAQARVGRPLTPMSVAGVARRQTRRAVVGAGIAGAAAVGAAGAIATAPYYAGGGPYASYGYGGWDEYAKRNGIVCRPGTLFTGADGQQHLCQ
jgi:hypothetical protein